MKKIITLLLISLIFIQCNSKKDSIIAKNQLGKINLNTKISELDKLFKKDSIVKLPKESDVFRKYEIYNKEGILLLIIKPKFRGDSLITIENIKIFSDKYNTEKGLSTASTYKDILDNYSISKIEPSFTSAIVFIDEINATVALDKKDLKLAEFDMNKIREDQIPDMAKIKYITLWFE